MDAQSRTVVYGLNGLAASVVKGLTDRQVEVHVVAGTEVEPYARLVRNTGAPILSSDDLESVLRQEAKEADCVLCLAEDDLENLRAAYIANDAQPKVPIVLRTFDATLADNLERSAGRLNVRRAYSMSSLAAPAFVALALADDHLLTMRFGDVEVPFCEITVDADSRAAQKKPADLTATYNCVVVARGQAEGGWQAHFDDATDELHKGDRLIVGGPLEAVLCLAKENNPRFKSRGVLSRVFRLWERARAGTRAIGGSWRQKKESPSSISPRQRRRWEGRELFAAIRWMYYPKSALILLLIVVVSGVVIFWLNAEGRRSWVEAIYLSIVSVKGEPIENPEAWLRFFAGVTVIAGATLAALVFSSISSLATTERLQQRSWRRARAMRDHVVVGGLGKVGFRVSKWLATLNIDTVVIDKEPDNSFSDALPGRTPVLSGDIGLAANLDRARVDDAACFMAVTGDDIANVEACQHAKSLNQDIFTVARIFDGYLCDLAVHEPALGVMQPRAAAVIAAPAFVDAAMDERVLRLFVQGSADRHEAPLEVAGQQLAGLRFEAGRDVDTREIDRWRAEGVRIVAFRRGPKGNVKGLKEFHAPMKPGDSAVIVGPKNVVERIAGSEADGSSLVLTIDDPLSERST
jgi:Trk K+ transport system NAD-binding subunit